MLQPGGGVVADLQPTHASFPQRRARSVSPKAAILHVAVYPARLLEPRCTNVMTCIRYIKVSTPLRWLDNPIAIGSDSVLPLTRVYIA